MHKGDVFTAATRRSDRAAMPIKNPANYWIGSVCVSRRWREHTYEFLQDYTINMEAGASVSGSASAITKDFR